MVLANPRKTHKERAHHFEPLVLPAKGTYIAHSCMHVCFVSIYKYNIHIYSVGQCHTCMLPFTHDNRAVRGAA